MGARGRVGNTGAESRPCRPWKPPDEPPSLPSSQIFAFTPDPAVRRRLNMRWGVMPFRMDFGEDPEENVDRSFRLMLSRSLVKHGDLVIVLSDLGYSREGQVMQREGSVRSIQIRRVVGPEGIEAAAETAVASSTGTKSMKEYGLIDKLARMSIDETSKKGAQDGNGSSP